MLIAILSGFVLSLAAPRIVQVGRLRGWLLALLPLTLTVYFLSFTPLIASGEAVSASYPWVPSLGIQLSFNLDGLSWLFALLVSGIGIFIFIYAGTYMEDEPLIGRFYAYMLIFMASMLGMVLSDNLITLFIFWELTSFSSYLLIGFKNGYEEARKAALRALLVTSGGGLAMMAGLILLGLQRPTSPVLLILPPLADARKLKRLPPLSPVVAMCRAHAQHRHWRAEV